MPADNVEPIGGRPKAENVERMRQLVELYAEGKVHGVGIITASDDGEHDFVFLDAPTSSRAHRSLFLSAHILADHLLKTSDL